jgi:hypothetical protein
MQQAEYYINANVDMQCLEKKFIDDYIGKYTTG